MSNKEDQLLAFLSGEDLWQKIERSVDGGARFFPFVARLSDLWQLSPQATKEVLARAANEETWMDFMDGCKLFHLEPGPGLDGSDAGIVRIPPESSFPAHRHGGTEDVLVLQGGFVDSSTGRVFRAGDRAQMHTGSEHKLTALPGETCVYAVVARGIEFVFE